MSETLDFDPLSEDYFQGAWITYRRLRDEAPVYRNEKYNFWALSRYEDVQAAFLDWSTFTSTQGIILDQLSIEGFDGTSIPGFLGLYDPPLHVRVRRLTSTALAPRAVGALEDATLRAIDTALDRLEDSSAPDFVVDFAEKFPAEIIYDLVGIPASDREHVAKLSSAFLSAGDEGAEDLFNSARIEAMQELIGYFAALAGEKRNSTQDDVITRMVSTKYVDEDGIAQNLSDTEMGGYLLELLAAGVESSTKLISGAFVMLQRRPRLWKETLADPSKLPTILDEAGRLESPVQFLGRKSTVDVTLHGVTVPAQSNFILLIAAGNRDDRVFEDPDDFRFDRKFARPPITFGHGPHACMGTHLARLEGRHALERFGRRFPEVSLDEDRLVRARSVHNFGWQQVPLVMS